MNIQRVILQLKQARHDESRDRTFWDPIGQLVIEGPEEAMEMLHGPESKAYGTFYGHGKIQGFFPDRENTAGSNTENNASPF